MNVTASLIAETSNAKLRLEGKKTIPLPFVHDAKYPKNGEQSATVIRPTRFLVSNVTAFILFFSLHPNVT